MKHLEREREGSGVDDKGRKDESKRQKTKTKLDVGAEIVAKTNTDNGDISTGSCSMIIRRDIGCVVLFAYSLITYIHLALPHSVKLASASI